jgi:hypothetical protein
VSITYGGSQIGLLVATDDEDEARQKADESCTGFGGGAKLFFVRKMVLQ